MRHYVCYPGAPVIETRTDDLSLAIRSRMRGTPGRTWQADDLSEADRAGIRSELDIYKQIRNTLADASAEVLTPQVAFENPGAGSRATVLPRELRPDVLDELSSVDTGVLGSALGSELSASGIEIDSSPRSRGQVLELAAPRRRNFGAVTDTRGKNVCIMHV